MRRVVRFAAFAVAVVAVLAGLLVLASETGEVAKITSVDEAGTFHETRVWVVDIAGETYVRAGTRESAWLDRVRTRSLVVLERAGVQREVRLVLAADQTPEVNLHMAHKYGWADMVVGTLVPRRNAVALQVVAP